MAASKIIVSENIEIPVVDGRMQCIRCKDWKLPGEMHFKDRTCQTCYETIRARNRDKPKPKRYNSKIIKKNAMGWVERVEKTTRAIEDLELAKMIILERAADRNILPEPITNDSIRVSDTDPQPTDDVQKDTPATLPITEDSIRVSDTASNIVSETKPQSIICDPKPKASDGIRVSDTRLIELERALGIANESLASALRRIRALEEKLEKLSPVIEREEAKRDAAGLQKLRDDLFKLLRERMEKSHTNGIYVHSLYGKNGRRGGKLNISKMQAFRLRDACRGDDRFRVEKTENRQGNWAILLNIHMN